jgi:hypothetical protein
MSLCKNDSAEPETVTTIKVQAWEGNYVQGLQLCNALNEVIAGVQCENAKQAYTNFSVRKDHSIVGVYGYMDGNKFIRGFGFITGNIHA